MVAEILASHGFTVNITARIPGRSADIVAFREDKLGIATKYLVECKRYKSERKIGLSIVNEVLGAAKREKADHAILVTTSSFSNYVMSREASLEDMRLHLRSGNNVRAWLRDYIPREDGGLWMSASSRVSLAQ